MNKHVSFKAKHIFFSIVTTLAESF